MKWFRHLSLLFIVLCSFTSWQTTYAQMASEWLPYRLVVKFKPAYKQYCEDEQITLPPWQNWLQEIGAHQVVRKFPYSSAPDALLLRQTEGKAVDITTIYDIDYVADISVQKLIQSALKNQELNQYIEYIEPDYILEPLDSYMPNDPQSQNMAYLALIQAAEGWGIQKGDTNIVVGVIDTSINWDHPDLKDNVKYNYADPINGIDDDNDGYVDNFRGWDLVGTYYGGPGDNNPRSFGANQHGTMVAGISSATTDNLVGVAGTGFRCKFLPIKCAADSGGYTNSIITGYQGIVYAADHGAQIINCSFGGLNKSALAQDIVNYATFNKNALVLAAAGNTSNMDYYYPASLDNVISVTATTDSDVIATVYNCKVDVCAPGIVRTTNESSGYTTMGTFTSFATPVAAGIAAIIKSQFPSYNALQVGEKLRVTCDDVYLINSAPQYAYNLGKGRVNMYRSLTINSPAVRVQNYTVNDGNDQILEGGEEVNFYGTFRNYLAPTQALTVSLESDSPFITFINASTTVGSINTLATKSNELPIRFVIAPEVPENATIDFRIKYLDGLYTDFECISVLVNPTYVNIDVGLVQSTINGIGKIGFNNFPNNTQGLGFQYQNRNYLYEGGLLIGNNSTKVVDNIRGTDGLISADFKPKQRASSLTPGLLSDEDALAIFDDQIATSNRLNVEVRLNTYAFAQAPNDKYIIYRYVIKNKNLFMLDSVYTALFADWDIGSNASNDFANFDSIQKLAYAYGASTGEPDIYVGMLPLTNLSTTQVYNTNFNDFVFSKAGKYQAISLEQLTQSNQDILQFLSQGPQAILPLDSIVVAFALLAGDNLSNLKTVATSATKKYNCLFSGPTVSLNLPPDTIVCKGITIDATAPNAVSYLWSNGSSNPVITINNTGTYSIQVSDINDCTVSSQVFVEVRKLNPKMIVSSQYLNIDEGATIYVEDSTDSATSWDWSFGDGYGSLERKTSHTYTEVGTFSLRLIVSDGICKDTLMRTIEVVKVSDRAELLHHGKIYVYPNPTDGNFTIHYPCNELATFELLDAQGKVLINTKLVPGMQEKLIETSSIPAGVYFYRVLNQQRIPITKALPILLR